MHFVPAVIEHHSCVGTPPSLTQWSVVSLYVPGRLWGCECGDRGRGWEDQCDRSGGATSSEDHWYVINLATNTVLEVVDYGSQV